MPLCSRKCLAENMPCLVQFSTIATSAKMPHRKYASSRPGSLYATKRGHASTATSPSHFLGLSISADRPITAQSLDRRGYKSRFAEELGHKQKAERSYNLVHQPTVVSAISLLGSCLRSFLGSSYSLGFRQCQLVTYAPKLQQGCGSSHS
jgi:hypothetical protein